MKKIILLLFFFSSSICMSQMCLNYKYHKLSDLGDEEGVRQYLCHNSTNDGVIEKVNLWRVKLDLNKIYKADLGIGKGFRYYKVLYNSDRCNDSGHDIDIPNFGNAIENLCHSVSWKYHKVYLLGNSEIEAKQKVCVDPLGGERHKLNILINSPLEIDRVYYLDIGNGKGFNYYYVELASFNGGDSDYEIYGNTFNNQPIEVFCDNDGDGISNSNDNCPNQTGLSLNNGCPLKKPDLVITNMTIEVDNFNPNDVDKTSMDNFNQYYYNGFLRIRKDKWHDICLEVKNNGGGTNLSSFALALTNNLNFVNATAFQSLGITHFQNEYVAEGASTTICARVYINEYYSNKHITKYPFIQVEIDNYNNIDESNEDNNYFNADLAYFSSRPIRIKNIEGLDIKSGIIRNKGEEKELIKSLPQGVYFIKKDGKRSQVYKQD